MDRGVGTRADRDHRGQMKGRRRVADERGRVLDVSVDAGDLPARRRARGATLTLVAVMAAALALGACSGDRLFGDHQSLMAPAPSPATAQTEASPAALREHQRILAAYGGGYDDPKLEAQVGAAVDRLVAASERPDTPYKVTILNSSAVNAFALPTGQLYVTRGLLALASDTSELASVLSHEMAHVIARHAAIREDQARQVSLASRVVNDVLSDPQEGALALARSKIAARDLLAPAGIRGGRHRRRHRGARRLRSVRRGALPHLDGPQRRPARRRQRQRGALARLPLVASGDARARQERADQCAPIFRPGRRRARPQPLSREPRRPRLRRGPGRRLCARTPLPASQARLHVHGAGRLLAREHRPGGARPARTAATRRCGSTPCGCRPSRA